MANDVSNGQVFGADDTSALLITAQSAEAWNNISKQGLAEKLVEKIVKHFGKESHSDGKNRARIITKR